MNSRVTFSVILPTFNRPHALEQCLAALARLDYPRDRWEVIVVDDGSPDSLDAVVTPYCRQMAVRLLRQTNAGPAAARNTGAAHAQYEFLAFVDDDCLVSPGWLDAFARRLAREPCQMVGGRTDNALPENVYSSASQLIVDLVYAHYNADPAHARFLASNNLALPADLFHRLGRFDRSFRTSEDRDLCDRWLAAGYPIVFAPEAVIGHSHPLTFRAFWKQHLQYGRGAFRFNRAHARRGARSSTLSADFYVALLRSLPRGLSGMPGRRVCALAALMIVWQVANTLGFVLEAARYSIRR